ncbi:hypothetical protein AMTRI_Chr12g269310 [Amborella trichopoda]
MFVCFYPFRNFRCSRKSKTSFSTWFHHFAAKISIFSRLSYISEVVEGFYRSHFNAARLICVLPLTWDSYSPFMRRSMRGNVDLFVHLTVLHIKPIFYLFMLLSHNYRFMACH